MVALLTSKFKTKISTFCRHIANIAPHRSWKTISSYSINRSVFITQQKFAFFTIRDKFFNKFWLFLLREPTRCTNFSKFYFGMKLYMFRTVPLSITRSFSLYTQQWYMSYMVADSLRAGSRSSILILPASCQQTCMTYIIAVCTVKNSWWWT